MRLTDKIATLPKDEPFYTFEFFPPRTDQGFDNLVARISRLSNLNPLAVSVTWGAGGTTIDRSLELAGVCQKQFGIDTILHLTCTNMEMGLVDNVLKDVKDRGIHNILALRGDPPRGAEHWLPIDSRFSHAQDLVSYIRSTKDSEDICIGVAGYPDGHPEQLLSAEEELDMLKMKVDAGADFIVTQLFYDADAFIRWVESVRSHNINVPIIPGIMPIQNYSAFLRLTKLCGSKVPAEIMQRLEPIKSDDRKVKEFGIILAVQMIQHIVHQSDIRGFHFCTLNLEKSVQSVLETLQWVGHRAESQNQVIADADESQQGHSLPNVNLRITPAAASTTAASSLAARPVSTAGPFEAGKGELNKAASWDEFPNGRFGDVKSPAYGSGVDLWTSGSSKPKNTSHQWADPVSVDDVTSLFIDYLLAHGEAAVPAVTPFTTSSLSDETLLILPHLITISRRGWWSVGSQPAVDGLSSDHEVFGWGPKGGWVFQKAFIELFVEEQTVYQLQELLQQRNDDTITFMAANSTDEFKSNLTIDGRNAVTWGVFPGHEIEQSTIIERESFLAWKEEAFAMWNQWALSFPPDSESRACLDNIASTRWLLSIVHHDYKNANHLWAFLESNFNI